MKKDVSGAGVCARAFGDQAPDLKALDAPSTAARGTMVADPKAFAVRDAKQADPTLLASKTHCLYSDTLMTRRHPCMVSTACRYMGQTDSLVRCLSPLKLVAMQDEGMLW